MSTKKKPDPIAHGHLTLNPVLGPRADGAWKWRAFWYEHNITRSKVLGWFKDPRAASLAGAALLANGLPARKTKEEQKELRFDTIKDLLESWVDSLDKRVGDLPGQLKPGTRDQYESRVAHLIGSLGIGDVALDRITAAVLADYRDRRLQGGAPSTVFQELLAVRIAWKWGRERGVVPDRDLPGCTVEIVGVRNAYTPTQNEVEAVLAQLDGWPQVGVLGLATTGARISELANVLATDLDLDAGLWNLRVGKSGIRQVPLRKEFVAAARAFRQLVDASPKMRAPGWPSAPEYLCGVKPKTFKTSLGDIFLARACRAAKVRVFTAHGLRRYWEDRLAEEGIDIAEYAAILGHSEMTALKNYRRVRPVNLRRAVASEGLAVSAPPTATKGSSRRKLSAADKAAQPKRVRKAKA